MKNAEGTPGKSLLRSTLGCCSPLGAPSPLHIQRMLWKSNSSQYLCQGIWYKYICLARIRPTPTSSSSFVPFVLIKRINHSALVVAYFVVRPFYVMCVNCFIELTLYSSHLLIVANKTWPIGGRIIEVPLYSVTG